MTLDPSYGDLTKIDFNDPGDLRRILYQDKHTRIEGLCSEAAFMEDVICGNLDPVTTDFWFSGLPHGGYHIRKIVTDPSVPLSELDYRILDGFASKSLPVSMAYFDETSKGFFQLHHEMGRRYSTLIGLGKIMTRAAHLPNVPETDRDAARLAKACDFLETRGLLKDAAIRRLFANGWLGESVWDIDVLTRSATGKVVAFEVKQKFPTFRGTYGINDGQKRLFEFLNRYGMPVIHVILRKPINDRRLHAVDLLTKEEYIAGTEWIYTLFNVSRLRQAANPAPKATSITGRTELDYCEISPENFFHLKKYKIAANDIRAKLLHGFE